MILAHLADLHLGYRAYHRMAPDGLNMRQHDVAEAFATALDRVIDIRPDLVLVAGDVFHTVRPSNAAITNAFRAFLRLRNALPDVPVVVISGNHDAPRSVETGSILRLLGEIPDVHVVDDAARNVVLESVDAEVLCVPHAALLGPEPVVFEPAGEAATSVLMVHGTVTGVGVEEKLRIIGEYGGGTVEIEELHPERWDYVALGHYHNATALAPNLWYAGSLERCSTNIWEEAGVKKGFLTFDTGAGEAEFHEVPTREVHDLPAIRAREDGRWLEAEELDALVRERIASVPGGIEEKIIRLVLRDTTRELFRQLDHVAIRQWRAEALHLHLDARRPEVRRPPPGGRNGVRRTLEEAVDVFLKESWEPSAADIRTDRLLELAGRYLSRARELGRDDARQAPLLELGEAAE